MTTNATLEKLDAMVGNNDLTLAEIKFVLKHWDDAARKLRNTNVIASVKAMDKIPAAVQIELIQSSDRATRAIGELLCVEAQDMILKGEDYGNDLAIVERLAAKLTHISDMMWRHFASLAKSSDLSARTVKALTARRDCPPAFAKAAGLTKAEFEKGQAKAAVGSRPVRKTAETTVKAAKKPSVGDDEDFKDSKRVASAARTVKRPRT